VLAQIAKDRPDIIRAEELRNILIDMCLSLEKVETEAEEQKEIASTRIDWIILALADSYAYSHFHPPAFLTSSCDTGVFQ